MDKVIGIDLGTTYSVMAHIDGGKPRVIPNAEGKLLTPSAVGWDKDGNIYVGEPARARAMFDPLRTVLSIKRRMGSGYMASIDGRPYTPQEISAHILRKLKDDAERYFEEEIGRAVITVPAYFSEAARQATKTAGQIAGFDVLRILNEPTAATLAYGFGSGTSELVMVCDLGGGTFDVSILEFANGVYEVRATSGDMWLGGDDWTAQLASLIGKKFVERWGRQVSTRSEIAERIKIAAEVMKIDLSDKMISEMNIPCLEDDEGHLRSLRHEIGRAEFEAATRELLERVAGPIKAAIRDSKAAVGDIDKVILVGGATRMPQIRTLVGDIVGKEPFTDIDPDLVVGLGAAVQAGIITGETGDAVLVDVIPLTLGIETRGGIFTGLIPRNSPVPTSHSQIFTTARDDQTEVDIHILQGERELASHNVSLGEFVLTDIPPLPKGMAKVEVEFSVDTNGMLEVSATDVYTDHAQAITVRSNRLTPDEIKKMAAEAARSKPNDAKACERIMARIVADDVINAAVETLPRLEAMDIQIGRVREAIEDSRRLLEEGDIDELNISIEHLKILMDEALGRSKAAAK